MPAALLVLVLALTIYSLLDCARTPEESMPARMPKLLWVALIAVITPIGPIAWIIVSRVKAAEERGGAVEPTVWSSKEGTQFRRPELSDRAPWLPTTIRSSCEVSSRTSAASAITPTRAVGNPPRTPAPMTTADSAPGCVIAASRVSSRP